MKEKHVVEMMILCCRALFPHASKERIESVLQEELANCDNSDQVLENLKKRLAD